MTSQGTWLELENDLRKLHYYLEFYKKNGKDDMYLEIRVLLKKIKKEFKHFHELIGMNEDVSKEDFDKMMRN